VADLTWLCPRNTTRRQKQTIWPSYKTKLPLTIGLVSKIFSTLLILTTSSKLALELLYDAQERS